MSDDQNGCEWVSFFWYRPTRVVPDQRPLNGCVCVCVCVFMTYVQASYYSTKRGSPVAHQTMEVEHYVFTARCYASVVLAMGLCLSVSVSVSLSQAGVLLKRQNVGSHKQHTIPQGL